MRRQPFIAIVLPLGGLLLYRLRLVADDRE
jgi:hypothetical protein